MVPKGIVLIDKPTGISSFDVIRRLRKKLDIRKMGHAGTLDPLASGLMIVGVGEGTKQLANYIKLPKVYDAQVLLGVRTDTGDLEGEVLEEALVPEIKHEVIEKEVSGLVGMLSLPVPAYSAIKQEGKRLYALARAGEEVAPPVRDMEVRAAELRDMSFTDKRGVLSLRLDVGSGTYIRSIAEELGRRLGYPATVKVLRRISIGEFSVEDAEQI